MNKEELKKLAIELDAKSFPANDLETHDFFVLAKKLANAIIVETE